MKLPSWRFTQWVTMKNVIDKNPSCHVYVFWILFLLKELPYERGAFSHIWKLIFLYWKRKSLFKPILITFWRTTTLWATILSSIFSRVRKLPSLCSTTNESNYESLIVCKLSMTNRMLSISGCLVGNLSDFEVMYMRPNWLIRSAIMSLNRTNYRRNINLLSLNI